MRAAMQPIVLPQPTIAAIRSSLMQFCNDTTTAPGERYCLIIVVAHSVSYDLTETKAMSIGRSFESCCTSVRCIVGTRTVQASSSVTPSSFRPSARIVSTCSGQGSISVTS